MAQKTKDIGIEIKPIKIQKATITLEGNSPLIVHAWSQKAKQMLLDAQMKKAKVKEIRNPYEDFINSLYWITPMPATMDESGFTAAVKKGAKFGFPSKGIKEAAVSAGFRAGVIKNKVSAYAAFHIDNEMVEIAGVPQMRKDMVRLSGIGGVADIRFRGEFKEWQAKFEIKFNVAVISAEIIVNLFSLAGFGVGIGEMRVEKGGEFGRFHVADIK
jgi:hypothetical protein